MNFLKVNLLKEITIYHLIELKVNIDTYLDKSFFGLLVLNSNSKNSHELSRNNLKELFSRFICLNKKISLNYVFEYLKNKNYITSKIT